MVESVGGPDSAQTGRSIVAMRRAGDALERFAPQTVVVMSPHAPSLPASFLVDTAPRYSGGLERFGASDPHLLYQGDTAFASGLLRQLARDGIPALDRANAAPLASGLLDHGVVVPMSFLDPAGRWPIVCISVSGLCLEAHRSLGRAVAEVSRALERRIAFIASGDLSHRLSPDAPGGFAPGAEHFDRTIVDLVSRGQLGALAQVDANLTEKAGECGLRSFVTLSGVIERPRARVLAYEAPWGVGYLTALCADAATYDRLNLGTPEDGVKHGTADSPGEHEIVSLARAAIETYVRTGAHLDPAPVGGIVLPSRAGVFVSLYAHGMLRGCIGTVAPVASTLAEEIVAHAILAATADPRFPAVTAEELSELEITVDVIRSIEPCDADDLDPSRYGVIVSAGNRRGVLLPALPGIDTADQQVAIARRKAGIPPGERVDFRRFKVDRHA